MAQDRTAEQREPREVDRPPEVQPPQTDLAARLERLPIGHPSSPYRDDGSRKPPPPDLSKYELPLPDEFDSPAEPDSAVRTGLALAQMVRGLGRLSSDSGRVPGRRSGLAKCHNAEGRDVDGKYGDHGLTPAMRRHRGPTRLRPLVEDTEKYALKDPDRFKKKLFESIRDEPDKSLEQHVDEIHDGIRYTFVSNGEEYVRTVNQAADILEANGFELGVRKNEWSNDEYKGVNTRWRDHESGCQFEIQFHTHESWQVKQATHNAYAQIHDTRTPTDERERLRAYQREISSSLALPLRVGTHHKLS